MNGSLVFSTKISEYEVFLGKEGLRFILPAEVIVS